MKNVKKIFLYTIVMLLTLTLVCVPFPVSAATIFEYPFNSITVNQPYAYDEQENEYFHTTAVVYGNFGGGRHDPPDFEDPMNAMYSYISVCAYGDGHTSLYDGQGNSQDEWVYTFDLSVSIIEQVPGGVNRVLCSDGSAFVAENEHVEVITNIYDMTLPLQGEIVLGSSSYVHVDGSSTPFSSNGMPESDGMSGWTCHFDGAEWITPQYD